MHRNLRAKSHLKFFTKKKPPKAVDYTTKNVVVADFGGRWTVEQALLSVLDSKEAIDNVAIVYRYKNGQTGSTVSNQSSEELHFKGGTLMSRALEYGA